MVGLFGFPGYIEILIVLLVGLAVPVGLFLIIRAAVRSGTKQAMRRDREDDDRKG